MKTLTRLGPRAALVLVAFGLKFRTKDGLRLPSKHLIRLCGLRELRQGSFYLLPTNPAVVVSELGGQPTSSDLRKLVLHVRTVVKQKTGAIVPVEPMLVGFGELESK